jgi:hypothetical protein
VAIAFPALRKETTLGGSDGNETAAMESSVFERTHDLNELEPTSLVWSKIEHLDVPSVPPTRYSAVVVATKVLGPQDAGGLKQMLCLLTAAYNRHVNYDILVFTTLQWEPSLIRQVRAVVPDTNLTFVIEGPPLDERVASMSPSERNFLFERCHVRRDENISWAHKCSDGPFVGRETQLSYAWQSEFRAYHVWSLPELRKYKHMLWMDTDAFCTRPWNDDPVKLMIENDLVLAFDNFPGGHTRNPQILDKLLRAYNRTICDIELDKMGRFRPIKKCDEELWLPQVHGFMTITNLDFFRSPSSRRFLRILVESHPFSREWDDQLAVTLPAAIEAPRRVRDLQRSGLNLSIYHNRQLDGKGDRLPGGRGFMKYWEKEVMDRWEAGKEMCNGLVVSRG